MGRLTFGLVGLMLAAVLVGCSSSGAASSVAAEPAASAPPPAAAPTPAECPPIKAVLTELAAHSGDSPEQLSDLSEQLASAHLDAVAAPPDDAGFMLLTTSQALLDLLMTEALPSIPVDQLESSKAAAAANFGHAHDQFVAVCGPLPATTLSVG